MNKVLCIGEALIDMICTDRGSSLTEGKQFLKKAGGAPANVTAAIAALGGNASLVAKVGSDPFGKHLLSVLQSFAVDTTYVFEDEEHFTTLAFVSLMENGERDFYFNRGADAYLTVEDIECIELEKYSIIHFGSATAFLPGPLQNSYSLLLERSLQKDIFISFDPNYRHLLFGNNQENFIKQALAFIQKCNFFKVSDEEALLLTGKEDVETAANSFFEKTSAAFAITLGKEGTLVGCNGTTARVPSIAVKAIDTTGAGDAFVGAVLYQLSSHTNSAAVKDLSYWTGIVKNANKAGARTCEFLGAMEAFKHLSGQILL